MNKAEILASFKALIDTNEHYASIKGEVESLKTEFSALKDEDRVHQLKAFIDAGGEEIAFKYAEDEVDTAFHDVLTTYEQRLNKQQEEKARQLTENLETKKKVISDLKQIVETDKRSLRSAYDKAKNLQKTWDESGRAITEEEHQLESEYKYLLDLFYHNANITRQFIVLDFKKNYDAKKVVVAKIADLVNDEDGQHAEQKLNQYRKEWYRIGPVLRELRDESKAALDEAIEAAQAHIKKYYEGQEGLMNDNLRKKIALCEQVNAIRAQEVKSPKAYQKLADEVIAIQNEWKTIGYSNENDKVWAVFRHACDDFFNTKRKFFAEISQRRKQNKIAKQKIIERAEALKDSEDWKGTTRELVNLQKDWKEIGPAQPSDDQRLWKKFRSACDHFFSKKSARFGELKGSYEENLKAKKALIKELRAFTVEDHPEEALSAIKEYQKQWRSMGHVPFKQKDAVYGEWFAVLNEKYDKMKLGKEAREELRFHNKFSAKGGGGRKSEAIRNERYKLLQQLERAEQRLAQYQNNVKFITGDANNPLLNNINKEISKAEKHIEDVKKKLNWLKEMQHKPIELVEASTSAEQSSGEEE